MIDITPNKAGQNNKGSVLILVGETERKARKKVVCATEGLKRRFFVVPYLSTDVEEI